jgi:hypothetical protein
MLKTAVTPHGIEEGMQSIPRVLPSVLHFFTLLSHKFQIPLLIGEAMPFCLLLLQVLLVATIINGDRR